MLQLKKILPIFLFAVSLLAAETPFTLRLHLTPGDCYERETSTTVSGLLPNSADFKTKLKYTVEEVNDDDSYVIKAETISIMPGSAKVIPGVKAAFLAITPYLPAARITVSSRGEYLKAGSLNASIDDILEYLQTCDQVPEETIKLFTSLLHLQHNLLIQPLFIFPKESIYEGYQWEDANDEPVMRCIVGKINENNQVDIYQDHQSSKTIPINGKEARVTSICKKAYTVDLQTGWIVTSKSSSIDTIELEVQDGPTVLPTLAISNKTTSKKI